MRIKRLDTILEALDDAPQYYEQHDVWLEYMTICIGETREGMYETVADYIEKFQVRRMNYQKYKGGNGNGNRKL